MDKELSRLIGNILTDLIKYKTQVNKPDTNDNIKIFVRKISDDITKATKTSKRNEHLLLDDLNALKIIIDTCYKPGFNDYENVITTIIFFTFIAESCKNIPTRRHDLIVQNTAKVFMTRFQARYSIKLFQQMYDKKERENYLIKEVIAFSVISIAAWACVHYKWT